MLQRILRNKIFMCLPKTFWLEHSNTFSNSVTTDENKSTSENAEESVKDNVESLYNTQVVSRLLQESATYKDANDKNWATTPYPTDVPTSQTKDKKPYVNEENRSVLLFPGQGIIKVGMVKKYINLSGAKELFNTANEILNYNLLKLCLEGPQKKLDRTEFNQPATVVLSLAALEKIREENPEVFNTCYAVAGYSVGEISALILSGALTFEDGIKLVGVRGKSMQYAADIVPQGMLAIFCKPDARVSIACQNALQWAMELGIDNPICRVAIFLHTGRKILAGNIEALKYIESHAEEYGLSNVQRLPVSGAFHTPLMEPALNSIHKILKSIEINEPRCQVYSNYKAVPYNLRSMKKYILKQIVSPVKWEQCMQRIYSRPEGIPFPKTYDISSEGRMRTILKLINLKASRSCTVI